MWIGIDQASGLIYEGISTPDLPAIPRPSLSQAMLIEVASDWNDVPSGYPPQPGSWVFREDSFDAVTRTRRGRLYKAADVQPTQERVAPHPYEDPHMRAMGRDGRQVKQIYSFSPCTPLLAKPFTGQGAILALGTRQASSAWRIVQVEQLVSADIMVTLKAMTAYGIVPELNTPAINEVHRLPVERAIARVVESAFRETPISVIDHCRNAATVVLSRWLVQQGEDAATLIKDLGAIAKIVGNEHYSRHCVRNMADTIAKLHVRGKDNEQQAKQLRLPLEEDAEMALQAIGFILRELGWAKL